MQTSFFPNQLIQETNMEKHNKGTRWDWHATASYPILCSNTWRRSDYNQTYLPITFRSLSKILLKWGRLSGSSSQHCVIRDWSSSLQAFASTTGRNGGSSCAVTRAIISVDRKSDNHWQCFFFVLFFFIFPFITGVQTLITSTCNKRQKARGKVNEQVESHDKRLLVMQSHRISCEPYLVVVEYTCYKVAFWSQFLVKLYHNCIHLLSVIPCCPCRHHVCVLGRTTTYLKNNEIHTISRKHLKLLCLVFEGNM